MSIILNLAIQSGKNDKGEDNSPDNSTPFPSQMEVDWVRYYEQRPPCKDVTITSASQYPLSNQVVNTITGKTIHINCNYTVQSGKNLKVIAQNSIKLGQGFKAEKGSLFSAKIDPAICGLTLKSENIDNAEDALVWEDNTQTTGIESEEMIESSDNITIFPNPTDGNFTIDFGTVDYTNFNVALTNMEGKLIFSIDKLQTPTTTITMKDNPNGIYVLYLFNKSEQSVITHKIIKQ